MIKKITLLFAFMFSCSFALLAQTKTAVFKFVENPWGLETATYGDPVEMGKLEETQKIIMGDVVLTNIKEHASYWNRIFNDMLSVYPMNHIVLTVPEEYVITRIDFLHKKYNGDLTVVKGGGTYGANEADEDTKHFWTGETSQLQLQADNGSAIFRTITVEYRSKTITGVNSLTTAATPDDIVYNLWGKAVARRSTFATLPAGIYIINGQKVQK